MIRPIEFITALRNSDKYIEMIYMNGGCYQFHLLLKELYPQGTPHAVKLGNHTKNADHIITEIDGMYYDIRGTFDIEKHPVMPVPAEAKEWSFYMNNGLCAECPNCEEIVFFGGLKDYSKG